ncbi:RHS repeat domain-containing protein [Stenotrophomonas sp. GZD-301]|uniref:RHS repeat domain-containing protein n=1 Tax=Stenotrophomonas sp. GZD-301 TaxID=3404814 RepID=UPI003BB7B667
MLSRVAHRLRLRCAAKPLLLLSMLASGLLAPLAAQAQIIPTWREEYDKRLKYGDLVEPLKGEIFGEKINLYDGSVSFSATDISLPGSNGLDVSISRGYSDIAGSRGDKEFGTWTLDVPSLSGIYGDQPETVSEGYWSPRARCSTVTAPPTLEVWNYRHTQTINFDPHTYWDGVRLTLPGGNGETVLAGSNDAKQPRPEVGQPTPWNTKGGWFFSCLASLKSGQPGEGFIGHSPDGNKYYFDWMVARDEDYAVLQPYDTVTHATLKRRKVFLYPSQVVDRFGNWVRYEWNGGQLQRINASDGRSISLAYDAQGRVVSASAGGRNWTYGYTPQGELQTVVLPDGTYWRYNLPPVGVTKKYPDYIGQAEVQYMDTPAMCAKTNKIVQTEVVISIKHPSGVVGAFAFRPFRHGRKNVPFNCQTSGDDQLLADGWNLTPIYRDAMSLVARTIEGPGVPRASWTYQYANLGGKYNREVRQQGWPMVPVGQSEPKITIETQPDGVVKTYEFGKEVAYNDGLLLATSTSSGGAVVRTDRSVYYPDAELATAPFPREAGRNLKYGATELGEHLNRPVQSTLTTQDGVQFTRTVQAFDPSVREIEVAESNSNGQGRSISTQYYDNPQLWVRGQVARSLVNGIEQSRTEFDTATAQPVRAYVFGRLAQQVTYAADGNVASVKDGNGNTTTLERWKLGIPQWIIHADGTMTRAAVNDSGWITAVADENDYLTQYEYDGMGRLTRVEYPSDDSVAWNAKRQALEWVPINEYGIPPGHWRQTTVTGNARKITYFDALLRPMLTQEFDAGNQAATQRLQLFAYDAQGRQTFSSYPVSDFPVPWKGTWKEYDALGRVTSSSQDSEHGLLTTLTEYLPSGQMRVTNPRGQVTQTRFQMFDEPSYEHPVSIQMPEGTVMNIARDIFNKPLIIARGNADGSQTVARRYVYSPSQQLCKTIEPETGSTLMDYDGAGNLIWSASGVDSPSPLTCNTEAISSSGRAVYREYDVRNRPIHLQFPDGNGNTSWTYTPDGLPSRLTVWNEGGATTASNHYTYNKRRLLTMEGLSQPGWYDWPIVYNYNANGHLAGQTWPSGLTVDYAPDALGQATRVGNFATDVRYHANGGIKQFTYGNGIVHTMQQNERQLPVRSTDSGVLDFDTRFDRNGNVSDIYDLALGAFYNRHMLYDGLDRLIAAESSNFGGDSWHRFSYDALDNLTSWMLPGVKDHRYWYDAHNRLTNVRDGAGNTLIGLSYDVQGNLKLKNGLNHVFDYGNRLREVSGKESYRYDALGRRIFASAPGLGVVLSQYAQDGRLVFQSDGRKGLGREYVHLAGSLIARRDYAGVDAKITYLHTDALGSPVASTDASGNVIERTHYEPYGAPIGKVVDGPGYTGHVMDGETGLVQMQQRYMDPQLGVFLSVDPVTAYDQPVGQFNRYRYANSNPYKFTDPDGRQALGAPRDFYNPVTAEQARQILPVVADFTPVLGDVKGIVEAIQAPTAANIAGAAIGLVPLAGDAGKAVLKHGDEAAQLGKMLASEQQMGELASGAVKVTHGASTPKPLRQAERLAGEYGGDASSYQKVSSSSYKAADGGHVETHAFRNADTGQIIEPKSVINP